MDLSLALTDALDRVDLALDRFASDEPRRTIRISVVPWYGNRFLAPSLPEFHRVNPDLNIELEYSYEPIEFRDDQFDAALRHGKGTWKNLSADRLHNDRVSPLCTPELLASTNYPICGKKIAEMDLAVARGHEAHWLRWLKLAGVNTKHKPQFVWFENHALAVEYCLSGNGVTLSDLPSLRDELQTGRVVRMHPQIIKLETGLHFVFPKSGASDAKLKRVAEWIRSAIPTLDELGDLGIPRPEPGRSQARR